jgi:ribonuclease J
MNRARHVQTVWGLVRRRSAISMLAIPLAAIRMIRARSPTAVGVAALNRDHDDSIRRSAVVSNMEATGRPDVEDFFKAARPIAKNTRRLESVPRNEQRDRYEPSMGFTCRIHRGAHEIGGNCIELESRGARIVLDLGRPITAADDTDVPLPPVQGLDGTDPSLLGVVLSHPHPDHYGLMSKLAPTVPLFMGEAASRILAEAAFFTPGGLVPAPRGYLRHRSTFELGPFRITPFLNDHSAFDAYSLLVEADDRRLFYTGDIRAHGRKAWVFEELLRRPPERVDVLLMEGTHVRADSDGSERGTSEVEVEAACANTFAATSGMALAMYSPQNIDRLVSMYRAALRTGRDLIIDLYTAAIAAATGLASIPQAGWPRVRVFLPKAQKAKVVRHRAFARTDAIRDRRIYANELRDRRDKLVMTFRASMADELAATGCLDDAVAVWSMWPGYLRTPSGVAISAKFEAHSIPMQIHHASGHAFIPDLQRLVTSIAPDRLVPIHSFAADRFASFFERVTQQPDGASWSV